MVKTYADAEDYSIAWCAFAVRYSLLIKMVKRERFFEGSETSLNGGCISVNMPDGETHVAWTAAYTIQ